jgi:CheY-like chemotaxis protein
VDLLLTDVVMPGGLNGDELAARARALRPAIKVLYTSGYTKDSMKSTLEEGAVLLSKPYQEGELARSLRRLLDA